MLIGDAKDGDESAREQLLAEMRQFLSMLANQNLDRELKQKIGASDIVQLSFLRVVEYFDTFKGKSAAEFRGWLKRIVINEINNSRRSFHTDKRDVKRERTLGPLDSRAPGTVAPDPQLTPSSDAMAAERIELFYSVLEELSPEHAEVIRLRSIQELSFKEIGSRMNRSEDAASKLWFRAMTRLEEKLAGRDELRFD
ncbi:MAG: sigma-70 family RNA polymerase sigma factor [Planctomycetota bacterium]